MENKTVETLIGLWSLAVQEDPQRRPSCKVEDGNFILTIKGKQEGWNEVVTAAGVPSTATQTITGDMLTCVWPSHADAIFGSGGLMAQRLPNYEVRVPQLHMARMVQRAIEMGQPAAIEAGTGVGKCVHGDTLITLADGTQARIADLVGHQTRIAKLNTDLKAEIGWTRACWASGRKPIVILKTRLGHQIRATKDHRFMTADGWRRLEELGQGDRVAVARFVPESVAPISMPEHEIVFLAHMITDGTATQAGDRGSVYYSKQDQVLIDDMSLACHGLGCELRKTKSGAYNWAVRRNGGSKRNPANILLENVGLAGKDSYGKHIPDCVFRLPNDQLAVFIGRLFCGDGNVEEQRRVVEYSSVSEHLIRQLQHLLLRFGIVAPISIKRGKYKGETHLSWRLTVNGTASLMPFCDTIGKHFVGAKAQKLRNLCTALPAKSNPNHDTIPKTIMPDVTAAMADSGLTMYRVREEGIYLRPGHKGISRGKLASLAELTHSPVLRTWAESDVYWDEIVSISDGGIAETFDIEMADGEPNFVADNLVVHNSFSYAAICMAMGKRVVISTSNKALQMQLYRKDIPFLRTLFSGKKVALVQGKANYACRIKAEDNAAGTYTIQGELLDWYVDTQSGNVEEIPFAVEPEVLRGITADAYCAGKHCAHYHDCFYYLSKIARADADILICNHMLLAMHQCFPGAGILPDAEVIIVDEAHKFADYMRNAIGTEFGLNSVEKRLRLAEKYEVETDVADKLKRNFFRAITDRVGDSAERQIGVDSHDVLTDGEKLAEEMMVIAEDIWAMGDMASDPEERRRKVDADQVRNLADSLSFFSKSSRAGFVRWIEQDDGALSCRHVPHDVSEHIARMAGFRQDAAAIIDHTYCSKCGRKLTSDTVAVLEGLPYGPDCIRKVDIMGDAQEAPLTEWLAKASVPPEALAHERTPIIFCSATLAAPDMAAFLRECGLPWALQMVAASPFDYERNALLYVPSAIAPAPGKGGDYDAWLTEEIERLVNASEGGAFLLFTSRKAMQDVSQRLRWGFERQGWPVFVQGSMPKLEITKRFMAAGNGVLFATKSFWEGVSIDGDALRLVVIDKIPFEAPTPLNTAQETALRLWARDQGMSEKEAEWYPFTALRVPKAIIDLKQGSGRLIRTATDWGCIAILDSRLRAAQYARRLVLPALPPAKLTCKMHEVDAFFQDRMHPAPLPLKALTPLQQVVEINDLQEIPF